jgi:NAD(P)-dependent dehydrogenase (short-subunit alcohol dehydrogenase family)
MGTTFTGKTALVTGAGRGLGRTIALGLGAEGAELILLARTAAQLDETRALLLAQGMPADRVRVLPADLADDTGRERATAAALAPGRVDILVNNAAIIEPLGPSPALTAAGIRLAFEVNVTAAIALTAAVLPGMLAAGWGRVVNISSHVAAHPSAMTGGNVYTATKAALEAHSVNLAAELSGTGVTVNAYRPGGVDTAMQAWVREQDPARIGHVLHDRFNQNFTDGGLITAEHSAAVLLGHLAGDDSGAIWDVDVARVGA